LNTSYWINKFDDKNIDQSSIKFSSDLNKTSLKNINKKNINNLLSVIPKKSIDEILIINKIFNGVIRSDKLRYFIKKIINYSKDITVKEVELCLKIDKTVDFAELSKKEKKKVQLIIKELLMENELKKIINSKNNLNDQEINDHLNNLVIIEKEKLDKKIENKEKHINNSYSGVLKNILDKYIR